MLRVRLRHAEPGMVIAETVRHPRHPGVLLLKPGARLDAPAIARLRELLVPEIWIRYPALAGLRRFHDPAVSRARDEAARRIAGALDALIADRHARLDYLGFRDVAAGLLAAVSASPLAALFISEQAAMGSAAARHAAVTCYLSILLGLRLDAYVVRQRERLAPGVAQDLTSLGLGGMLHDVGLTALDDATLARFSDSADEDDPLWRRHVRLGFDMVKDEFDPAVAACVLHHHQRFDGSGFPGRRALDGTLQPMAGEEIHVFARIVAVAECFDRLRFPEHSPNARPGETPVMPTVRALKRVLDAAAPVRESPGALDGAPPGGRPGVPEGAGPRSPGGRFDPAVVRALLSVVPPFAPGSLVHLSDGRQGVVSDWSPRSPCRCRVEILDRDSRQRGRAWWQEAPVEHVDLARASPDLRVVEAEGFDVSADQFEHPFPGGRPVEPRDRRPQARRTPGRVRGGGP